MTVEEKLDVIISKFLPELLKRLKELDARTVDVNIRADMEAVRQSTMRQVSLLSDNLRALGERMNAVEDGVANRREETEVLNGLSIDAQKEMDAIKAQVADIRQAVDTLVKVMGTLNEERPRKTRRKKAEPAQDVEPVEPVEEVEPDIIGSEM